VFTQIRQFIKTCLEEHPLCQSECPELPLLPKRVLEISTDRVVLFETTGQSERYVALSYCWGNSNFIRTTQSTLNQHKARILTDSLPRVFQEAIRVTLELGVNHIWIDALCILQDSSEDWEIESSKMGDTYSNAYVTIAAALSPTPYDSMVKTRPAPKRIAAIDYRGDDREIFVRHKSNHIKAREDDPLSTRGWAYQERELAERLLYFTSLELVFRCQTSDSCECLSEPNPRGKWRGEKYHQDNWNYYVSQYSVLDLTYAQDRLPAFSGIAHKFNLTTHNLGRYFAGLWESHMPTSLFWAVENPSRPRSQVYIAPSWSWASVPNKAYFKNQIIMEDHDKTFFSALWTCNICIIAVESTPKGRDPSALCLMVTSKYVRVYLPYLTKL
jgi:hypothetical protein